MSSEIQVKPFHSLRFDKNIKKENEKMKVQIYILH